MTHLVAHRLAALRARAVSGLRTAGGRTVTMPKPLDDPTRRAPSCVGQRPGAPPTVCS